MEKELYEKVNKIYNEYKQACDLLDNLRCEHKLLPKSLYNSLDYEMSNNEFIWIFKHELEKWKNNIN